MRRGLAGLVLLAACAAPPLHDPACLSGNPRGPVHLVFHAPPPG